MEQDESRTNRPKARGGKRQCRMLGDEAVDETPSGECREGKCGQRDEKDPMGGQVERGYQNVRRIEVHKKVLIAEKRPEARKAHKGEDCFPSPVKYGGRIGHL